MKTIGIELNHVVRNINKQIVKYYAKAYEPEMEIDEIDCTQNIFDTCVKFKSQNEKGKFLYEDYPYEIFGCADTMEKKLPTMLTNWLKDISDIEDEDIRIIFYSLNEEALTIQSTFFFLSKIGTRVRKVLFPKSISEVYDECDVIITARDEFFEKDIPDEKKLVLIRKPFNAQYHSKGFLEYDSLSDVIKDEEFFKKVNIIK